MINYDSIIDILQSDGYLDKSRIFECFIEERFTTLGNCIGTGSSLFLKTFSCFLDRSVNTEYVFRNMEIGRCKLFSKEINSYDVILLDFSDFNAKNFKEAMEYITCKMSETYKVFYDCFTSESISYNYHVHEEAIGIIEKTATQRGICNSLWLLLTTLRKSVRSVNYRKVALLIDNLVQIEVIAEKEGYLESITEFLRDFIVEDVYKFCDLFLQLGDYPINDSWLIGNHYMTYTHFGILPSDVGKNYRELVVETDLQHLFKCEPILTIKSDWNGIIINGRKRIKEAKALEEQKKQENFLREKLRYAENLSEDVPLVSSNLGIRKKHLDKSCLRYKELNELLNDLYRRASPDFSVYNIYKHMLCIDENKIIVDRHKELAATIKGLAKMNQKWKNSIVDTSTGSWVQVTYSHNDGSHSISPGCPQNLKVYANLVEIDSIQDVFVKSLKYLLQNASNTFAAKMATFARKDQMCYWLSPTDLCHLEDFYQHYSERMVAAMPFMAYKGKLGISKDFPCTDCSHNSMQAHIIADYFNSITRVDDVDLEDMYNIYIAKWNADVYEEKDYGSFRMSSALSFIVIMDTLDAILEKRILTDESFLLSSNYDKIWNNLACSECWADLNRMYHIVK